MGGSRDCAQASGWDARNEETAAVAGATTTDDDVAAAEVEPEATEEDIGST